MVLVVASLSPRENETFVMYIGRDFNDFGRPPASARGRAGEVQSIRTGSDR